MATIPNPWVPVAGDDATAARLLTLSDAVKFLLGSATSGGSKRPLAVLRQTVAQSVATGAAGAAVTFNVEDFDYDNGHSTITSTSKYIANTAGLHFFAFKGGLVAPAATAGYGQAWLRTTPSGGAVADENGTAVTVPGSTAAAYNLAGGKGIFLNVGDAVELWVAQTSGAAVNTSVAGAGQSLMTVWWLSN